MYSGSWEDGQIHGKSVFTYPKHGNDKKGDIYDGMFKKNKKHGEGAYIYANGDIYVGEYYKDRKRNEGHYRYANGDTYGGTFNDGEPIQYTELGNKSNENIFQNYLDKYGPWRQGKTLKV